MHEKILLIDDDPAVRRMLSRVLAEENYFVVATSEGWEFLGLTQQVQFELALLDLSRDPAKGLAVFEGLNSRYPLLPVIMMTEQADRFISKSFPSSTVIMEKPLDLAKLLQIIRTLLGRLAQNGAARTPPQPPEAYHCPLSTAELAGASGGKNGS